MNYQILRKITEGGFSEIFEVRDPASALDETLILKRLSPDMSARAAVCRAFTQEGEILANLRHPNVVTFRRCYYEAGHICLVMEKIDGEDLMAWARETRHDPAQVIDAFRKILEAVDYLHHRSAPVLHLDLKPENILVHVTPSGPEPVLIDFGIARAVRGQGLRAYTPPYAAPEQVRGGELGCFTDVYALGQILSELLDVLGDTLDPRQREALRSTSERAMSPPRWRRFADAGEMLGSFRQARASTLHASEGLAWGRGFVAAAVVAGVVGLLAMILLLVSRPSGPPAPSGPAAPVAAAEAATDPFAGRFEPCLRPELYAGDSDSLSREFDRCFGRALQSNRIALMNAQYLEARQFLEQRPADESTQRFLQRKLADFKRQIDFMTTEFQR